MSRQKVNVMASQSRQAAHLDAIHELERLQMELEEKWLDQSLPDDWSGLDWWDPVDRHKTRVTLRLDTDMLRWFRKLGPGYQKRLNSILRIYWASMLAGHIKAYPNDKTLPRLAIESDRIHQELLASRGGWSE